MSDDKKISQLISLSLRHELSQQESAEVEKHLSENDDSRKFAELSSLIQKSVATNLDPDQTASDKDNGGLSEESKQRLKRSVTEAVQEKLSLSKAGLLGDTGAPTKSQSKTDAAGFGAVPEKREVMSRFNLIRRLGQGGLGNVWLARDEKLNRTVAIKELNAEALESPKAWERFHREAEITGHLEHPNIVPLYQFGVDRKTGEPFYAMRFVGKRTLAHAIEEYYDRLEIGEAGAAPMDDA